MGKHSCKWGIDTYTMFFEFLSKPYPNGIKDVNLNDHYQPNQDMMNNWTTIVEKDEGGVICLST